MQSIQLSQESKYCSIQHLKNIEILLSFYVMWHDVLLHDEKVS